jgi:hypothetical protein
MVEIGQTGPAGAGAGQRVDLRDRHLAQQRLTILLGLGSIVGGSRPVGRRPGPGPLFRLKSKLGVAPR